MKSSREALLVPPGVTLSGWLVDAFVVVWDGGVQIGALFVGFDASASTVYGTSPDAGAVKVTLPAESKPTFGLLAGTINV